jgi:lipid-binding SYLF domain-containing protein
MAAPDKGIPQAGTDAKMQAEILTDSRARGVFAGVSLGGATLRPDEDTNAELYGSKLDSKTIVMGNTEGPAAAAAELISAHTTYSAHKE